jgi:hypothetical protein
MLKKVPFLAGAVALAQFTASASPYADSVVNYTPGTGGIAGYNDASTALGSPSRQTVDTTPIFGGTFPVDPFGPPYLDSQVVSIGAGGSLTVFFNDPILNAPANAYGRDFSIFGNNFFDSAPPTFDHATGTIESPGANTAEVWVSANGTDFYRLNPALAPVVDGSFPTDGSGNFSKVVNPALLGADFAGKDLAGIRSLYDGSGGGASFDIGWAQTPDGNTIHLDSIQYIQVRVLDKKVEIDGFAAVPEPGTIALGLCGGVVGLMISRKRKCVR